MTPVESLQAPAPRPAPAPNRPIDGEVQLPGLPDGPTLWALLKALAVEISRSPEGIVVVRDGDGEVLGSYSPTIQRVRNSRGTWDVTVQGDPNDPAGRVFSWALWVGDVLRYHGVEVGSEFRP